MNLNTLLQGNHKLSSQDSARGTRDVILEGRKHVSDIFLLCACCLSPLQGTPRTSRMLLTGSRWFWISSPWLSMQACSRTPAGRCAGRALQGQHTAAHTLTLRLSPHLFPCAGFRPALCGKSWSNLNGKAGRKLPWVSSSFPKCSTGGMSLWAHLTAINCVAR